MRSHTSQTMVLDAQKIEHKLCRMAWEIYEKNHLETEIVIAGISPQGAILSKRLAHHITTISNMSTEVIEVNIDKKKPLSTPVKVSNHQPLNDKVVVLVDDVLKSGKTLMYCTTYFLNQPIKKLMTAILIDRNYKMYPIKADVVGLKLSTTMQEHVSVVFGQNEAVFLI